MEFRDYIAILGGLVGILATFIWIMGMLVQQINKRIDDFRDNMDKRLGELRDDMDTKFEDVYRRLGELRGEISGLREEIKEIRLLLYKVLEIPHKQGE